jgi:hypothetical protein
LVFESERVFCDFQNLILTSFFHNFWKVWKRTNSKFYVNSKCSETPVFDPKTGVSKLFDPKTGFLTQKQEIISELISEQFSQNSELQKPNISELVKTKSSEISV